MASFTPSAVISEIRGRVGTSIWSKNLYGVYVKNSYAPTNPNTTLQQNARANFNTARAAWNALADTRKRQWEQKAKGLPVQDRLGNPIILTGKMFYMKRKLNAINVGLSVPIVPLPDQPTPRVTPLMTASISSGIEITYNQEGDDGNWWFSYAMTPPLSPTINAPARGRASFFTIFPLNGSSPINTTSTYTARFGSLSGLAGQKIFAYIWATRDGTGQKTVEQRISAIITV